MTSERKSLFKESTKIYESERLDAMAFLSSLEDLKIYKTADWKIIVEDYYYQMQDIVWFSMYVKVKQ